MLNILKIIVALCSLSCVSIYAKPPIFVETAEDAFILSEDTDLDVLLIFTADWCVACTVLKNDIHEDLNMVENNIICYVNFDNRKDLVKEYQVRSIPDCIVYRKKREIKRKIGYKSKIEFKKWLEN